MSSSTLREIAPDLRLERFVQPWQRNIEPVVDAGVGAVTIFPQNRIEKK
jgi:hypothetical protein